MSRIRVPIHTRLYVWSVIFEPLFFFVLFEESVLGITGNLSRLLQMVTIVVLAFRLLLQALTPGAAARWRLPALHRPLYRYFVAMIGLAMAAGIIGAIRGAYELPVGHLLVFERSAVSAWITSSTIRPVFEYVTAGYYFVYFVVVPQYLFRSPADIDYCLSRFKRVFIAVFIIGIADLAIATVLASNSLIWRHLSDGVPVEGRFHSLAGEPRQAFVYLFLGLAMLHLRSFQKGQGLSRWWLIAIVTAAMLTQSATGVVATAIFAVLWAAYSLRYLSVRHFLQLSAGLVVIFALAYVAVVNSPRTLAYFQSASDLWRVLESGDELPYLMSKSNSDIYPMYDLTVKARQGDLLPVFSALVLDPRLPLPIVTTGLLPV